MSDRIKIGPACTQDALDVLNNLAAGDYEEVVASVGYRPAALLASLPPNTKIGYLDDKPVCIFGVGLDADGAHPFLLCTYDIRGTALGRFMVRYGRGQMIRWAIKYGPLTNVVHTRNVGHVRFVKALGCTLGETTRRGPLHQHFTEFSYVPPHARGSSRTNL